MESQRPTKFEEMNVGKFQWLLRTSALPLPCALPSLKMAAKYEAVEGIILSSLILVLGTGGNFLMAWIIRNSYELRYKYGRPEAFAINGVIYLAIGAFLLIFNLILDSRVKANQALGVSKIIKVGCLVSLYIELITGFTSLVVKTIFYQNNLYLYLGILLNSLFFLLTALVIYGIHGVRPKIVSAYIYIKTILFALAIPLIWFGIWYFAFYLMIIPCIFIMVFMDYHLKLFALQINMMSNGPVSNAHHQLYINT